MDIGAFLLVLLGGAVMPIQAGINAQLQQVWAGNTLVAAFISFIVGTLGLAAVLLVTQTPIPALNGKTNWYLWIGGLMGAYLVTVITFVAPRIGAATMLGLILLGQIGVSLILDHFGLLGYVQRSISWQKIMGIVLLVLGVILIRKY